jgi:TIR domain
MSDKRKTVFISYSSADRSAANEIKAAIPTELNVWMAEDKIQVGERIATSIEKALNGSDYSSAASSARITMSANST